VPLFNEEENVSLLIDQIIGSLEKLDYQWEVILVDDGSTDNSLEKTLEEISKHSAKFKVIEMQRNFGQTSAMQAGIDHSSGEIIVTIDGDLQNDPQDIPRLVKRFINEDLDLLVGRRKKRRDNFLLRTLPSIIANQLIGSVTGVKLHDYGCSLKVYKASIIKNVRLYGEMHRFIPAWVATVTNPQKIAEEIVTHHPRKHGKSKYGLSRTFRIILDLLVVFFFMRFRGKPGHFFGAIGLVLGFLGTVSLSYLGIIKFYFGEDIGSRPLLFIGILLILSSIQLLTTGIITELIARTYFEASNSKAYMIRKIYEFDG
ncbi:glycosyltransferase family 2 protein, partial [Bacteroidota bacterium]